VTFERVLDERYVISDDVGRLDVGGIHAFLGREAFWCVGIPRAVLERASRKDA